MEQISLIIVSLRLRDYRAFLQFYTSDGAN